MDRPVTPVTFVFCGNCRFYESGETHVREAGEEYIYDGRCRRYPKIEGKDPHDWCGEHKRDHEKPDRLVIG